MHTFTHTHPHPYTHTPHTHTYTPYRHTCIHAHKDTHIYTEQRREEFDFITKMQRSQELDITKKNAKK